MEPKHGHFIDVMIEETLPELPVRMQIHVGGVEALRANPDAAMTLKKIALLSSGLRAALMIFKEQLNLSKEQKNESN